MSNPKVRSHLRFYPEDTGSTLSEAHQASCWLNELTPEETTLMVRINDSDYFIYEPAMAADMAFCIPTRLFYRYGLIHARVWVLDSEAIVVEGQSGWIVNQDQEIEIHQDQLLKRFSHLVADHK